MKILIIFLLSIPLLVKSQTVKLYAKMGGNIYEMPDSTYSINDSTGDVIIKLSTENEKDSIAWYKGTIKNGQLQLIKVKPASLEKPKRRK